MQYEAVYTADPATYIGKFLWSIHTNWSFVFGQMPIDPIDQRIKTLCPLYFSAS